jgi:small subunit ribosomal protein S17
MAKKKTDETSEVIDAAEIEVTTDNAVEAQADNSADASSEPGESSIVEDVIDTVASAAETVVETIGAGASAIASAVTGSDEPKQVAKGKRAEKIGVVSSDKMTNTVVVRVDRLVKHPIYRKYIRKRKKFMAHDETGAKIGDKVRIVETRPLSARKRWRVVEIIHKAEL